MIYFDNAATSRPKPEEVYDAFNYFVREVGTSPGRGSYSLGIEASRMLFNARKTVARFFGGVDPACVIFTKNSTEAINLFFNGFLKVGDHVLISPYEHNAVLRPLQSLKNQKIIDYSVLPESVLYGNAEQLEGYIRENTKLLALTLASNLTGQVVFNKDLSKIAHTHNVAVFVDASQGAGKKLVGLGEDGIDVLAFTGHKDLLALPGTGGLVSLSPLCIPPLIQGGTGIHGESYVNPEAYPDSYEAGTLNMPAIWALKAALDYIDAHIEEIQKKERDLIDYLIDQLSNMERVILYKANFKRVPTLCFNVKGIPSSDVVRILDHQDICVRGGIHCAIKAHEALGTVKTGAVRVSLNHYNTFEEIDVLINVLRSIA